MRNSVPKMSPIAIGTTRPSRFEARSKFSNWPAPFEVHPLGQLDLGRHGRLRVLDEAHEISSAHVGLDQYAALQRFAVDHRRPLGLADIRHLRQGDELTVRRPHEEVAEGLGRERGGRQEQHEIEAPRALEDASGKATHPRGLDDLQDLFRRDAVSREARPVRLDLEERQTEHPLHPEIAAARNVADDAADLVRRGLEHAQVIAEHLDHHVGARAGQELIDAVLDGLRYAHERRRHLGLDRLLDLLPERVEVLGGGPFFLGLELDHHLTLIRSHRIDGDPRGARCGSRPTAPRGSAPAPPPPGGRGAAPR